MSRGWATVTHTPIAVRPPSAPAGSVRISAKTTAADVRAKIAAQVDAALAAYNETITNSLYRTGGGFVTPATPKPAEPPAIGRDLDAFPSVDQVGRR